MAAVRVAINHYRLTNIGVDSTASICMEEAQYLGEMHLDHARCCTVQSQSTGIIPNTRTTSSSYMFSQT